jgi:hypothetical protein
MIEKSVFYTIDGRTAVTIRKVLAHIKTVNFKSDYSLSEGEISDIHAYLTNVELEYDTEDKDD